MRSMIKKCSYLKIAPVVFLITLLLMPALALSAETYKFERMWPTLKQPWYFFAPHAVAVDQSGYVYIAESGGNRVVKLDSNGYMVTQWGSSGTGEGQFSSPEGIAVDVAGNIHVSEWGGASNPEIHSIWWFYIYGGQLWKRSGTIRWSGWSCV